MKHNIALVTLIVGFCLSLQTAQASWKTEIIEWGIKGFKSFFSSGDEVVTAASVGARVVGVRAINALDCEDINKVSIVIDEALVFERPSKDSPAIALAKKDEQVCVQSRNGAWLELDPGWLEASATDM